MGWALDNMNADRRREIAEGLIKVEKVYGTKLHGFCPVHGDQKSASAFYNWEKDSGSCKSCGEKWDLVKLWCLVNGYDPQDLKAFREEFDQDYTGGARHLRKPAAKPASRPDPSPVAPEVFIDPADLEALPPLSGDMKRYLIDKRMWSPAAMEIMDLREFADAKKEKRIAMPILTDSGKVGNIRLYKPGADQFKVISWYDRQCKACGGGWKVQPDKSKVCRKCGGRPNDYGRTRLYPSPAQWKPGLIWLCEGEPDLLCALSMGLNAVTQTAGCGTWPAEFSEHFTGRDVIIAYDADEAGLKGARKAAESLADHAKSVRIIIWPEMMGNGQN